VKPVRTKASQNEVAVQQFCRLLVTGRRRVRSPSPSDNIVRFVFDLLQRAAGSGIGQDYPAMRTTINNTVAITRDTGDDVFHPFADAWVLN